MDNPSVEDVLREFKEQFGEYLESAKARHEMQTEAGELALRRLLESLTTEQLEQMQGIMQMLLKDSEHREGMIGIMHAHFTAEQWRRKPIGAVEES